ncbi:Gag-pol fusion protein [Phytophthora palmivora]|uniref:Gag-pol fusion protein n=1 Tax=Phytophthora palmivora TaxID=4796 RepID=A0A2P4YSD4_9STRA|nr:Gag-pol fusion protein [Phytophthora palmivora]
MGHVDGLSRHHQTTICALTMSDLLNDAGEDPSTVLGGEEQPTSTHEPTEQLSVSAVYMFGLDQERFVAEQRQTPWIMALIAFLESGAHALDAQLHAKVLLMAPNYVVKNDVLMRRAHLKARAAYARTIEVPYYIIVLRMVGQLTWVSLKQETELGDMHTGTVGSELSMNMPKRVAVVVVERAIALGKWVYAEDARPRPIRSNFIASRDVVGPLVTTPRGNKFILVFTDYFTRWVEAFPFKRLDTVTFVAMMVNEVISRHGVPERLLSDQGSNFISELARSFYETLGIKKPFGAAYHHQTQGLVGRFNGTLSGMLKMFVNDKSTHFCVIVASVCGLSTQATFAN